VIAFVGGTGPEGLGLACRFALAGEEVGIGSRSRERAVEAAAKVRAKVPEARVFGDENQDVVRRGEIIFVTLPFTAHRSTLEGLREEIGDKVVIDVTVPVAFQEGIFVAVPVAEGSAAEQTQALLPQARVASGFHHLDAAHLMRVERAVEGDIIVCGDHREAKEAALALAAEVQGARAVDGGPLQSARYLEAFTVLLLTLNKLHKARTGLHITGLRV